MKKIDVFEDERLKPYEILIEAKGETDYYDKLQLVSYVERFYNELKIGKIKRKDRSQEKEIILIKNFMSEYKKLKGGV